MEAMRPKCMWRWPLHKLQVTQRGKFHGEVLHRLSGLIDDQNV